MTPLRKNENCVLCKKELETAVPDEFPFQPYAGGEIELKFCYGSTKFDKNSGMTIFKGYICDDCATTMVPHMVESGTDLHGNDMKSEEAKQAQEEAFAMLKNSWGGHE